MTNEKSPKNISKWTVELFESPGQGEWHGWKIVGPRGIVTWIWAASQRGPIDMDENRANAYLIAAAPEMYEYLRQMRDNSEGLTRENINRILKKIEGNQ